MLVQLDIRDFAIISEQSVLFAPGLNVITGETGAGKSILLNALDIILGGRASSLQVRQGADNAEVQALFDLSQLGDQVRASLPDIAQGEELIISRTVSTAGRSRVYVNGKLSTVSLLGEITPLLVTLCGQSEYVQLLEAKTHTAMIDRLGGYTELQKLYGDSFRRWKSLCRELEEVLAQLSSAATRREHLQFQREDLSRVAELDSREELESRIKYLSSGERLLQSGQEVLNSLAGERGVLSRLSEVTREVEDLTSVDVALTPTSELFRSALTQLEEAEGDLSAYLSSVELDEGELEEKRDQLALIARLERKFNAPGELTQVLARVEAEMSSLPTGERIESLERAVAESRARLEELGRELSHARRVTAEEFTEQVQRELAELGMKDSLVTLELTPEPTPTASGLEHGEFFLRRGEVVRPLRRIASGGELSRLTLVMKKLLRDSAKINVLVFDEVDTGISGGVARAVGKKLKELAAHSQVLCITHLPQVASLADHHLLVEKSGRDRQSTKVTHLHGDAQVEEIARMLSGLKVTKAARESARELLSSH